MSQVGQQPLADPQILKKSRKDFRPTKFIALKRSELEFIES